MFVTIGKCYSREIPMRSKDQSQTHFGASSPCYLNIVGVLPKISYVSLESGMVFEGTTGVYERIYPFNSN